MRLAFILTATAFTAMASTAHATECYSSAIAVWAAHPGSHATWRLRLPGHVGEKCWFPTSKSRVMLADASRDADHGTRRVSKVAVPRPRAHFQDTLTVTEGGPLSILVWAGQPMRIDSTWDKIFEGRERMGPTSATK